MSLLHPPLPDPSASWRVGSHHHCGAAAVKGAVHLCSLCPPQAAVVCGARRDWTLGLPCHPLRCTLPLLATIFPDPAYGLYRDILLCLRGKIKISLPVKRGKLGGFVFFPCPLCCVAGSSSTGCYRRWFGGFTRLLSGCCSRAAVFLFINATGWTWRRIMAMRKTFYYPQAPSSTPYLW